MVVFLSLIKSDEAGRRYYSSFISTSNVQTTTQILSGLVKSYEIFNPLALELDIYSLAHHLCKM